jgi:hypothetical protein
MLFAERSRRMRRYEMALISRMIRILRLRLTHGVGFRSRRVREAAARWAEYMQVTSHPPLPSYPAHCAGDALGERAARPRWGLDTARRMSRLARWIPAFARMTDSARLS